MTLDWLNLPPAHPPMSMMDSLHDAEVVSIRSNPLDRTVRLVLEIEHLRSFHHMDEGSQFVILLEGVRSARVMRYAVWPGEFSIPVGVSREEESRLIAEYQAKWREESLSWNEFEAAVTRQHEQVFDISEAEIVLSHEEVVALRLSGHLNNATYHEVFLRAASLTIVAGEKELRIEEFQQMGAKYWEAFSNRKPTGQTE